MGESFPGGREIIRQALIVQGVPDEAIDISLASISASTLKNYSGSLKRWWNFCKANDCNLFDPEIKMVLSFLSKEYERNLSHSTLNGIRSAIALISIKNIANDSRVSRFFAGISKSRPSKPKYNYTWDPKVLLNYFSSLDFNENLSLKVISKKLISLLALVTGHRMQTFSLIMLENIKTSESKIEIFIPDRIKTSKKGSLQPLLNLPFFSDKKLCAASCLKHYLILTNNLRGSVKELFISTYRPFKAVKTETLSRWVKESLSESGIDTSIFSAHSTRHASTSAAKRSGVDIDLIRKTVGWSNNSSTFARFYDRDIINNNDDFALSIFNL